MKDTSTARPPDCPPRHCADANRSHFRTRLPNTRRQRSNCPNLPKSNKAKLPVHRPRRRASAHYPSPDECQLFAKPQSIHPKKQKDVHKTKPNPNWGRPKAVSTDCHAKHHRALGHREKDRYRNDAQGPTLPRP